MDTLAQPSSIKSEETIAKAPSTITTLFSNTRLILSISLLFRAALLLWGEYQDTNSPLKYTDIDYLVFTDASRYVFHNQSPYLRDTYRYTPLLAWLLYPTALGGRWFCFGKAVFAVGDVVTGWLIFLLLRKQMQRAKAMHVLNMVIYGMEFVRHSYTYHLTRIDHRHNFSVYNTLLHFKSAVGSSSGLGVESLAFFPQLFLSVVAVPLLLAKKNLASTMLAQTFAFVTFNKVCTSQYFLWYMVFLPFYLPTSSLIRQPKLGFSALGLWVIGQALWLQQGYMLEFLGKSTFVPGLWVASVLFFGINCWILGIVVSDIAHQPSSPSIK
ncbi:glycosyltransferase family 50 protein, partial [Aureobasidium sp. EXF-3399]